jgi:hypothetical protein
MKPIYEAKKIALEAGKNFEEELAFYLEHGGVISLPDRFIMGRAIQLSLGEDVINPPNPDCWYVHCGTLRVYNTDTVERLARSSN